MDSVKNLFIDMNEEYNVAIERVCKLWNLREIQRDGCANIFIVNTRDRHMGQLHISRGNEGRINITTRMEVFYVYRGYVQRMKYNYTEYNFVNREFRNIESDAFAYWLIQFIDYCRNIEINDEIMYNELSHVYATECLMELTEDDGMHLYKLPMEEEYCRLLNVTY